MPTCFLYTSALKFNAELDDPGYGADVVMLDLEDAVHTSQKQQARNALAQLDLRPLVERGRRFGVRINSTFSMEGVRDLALVHSLCETGKLAIEFFQMPKVRSHHEVLWCRSLMSGLSTPLKMFPIVETPEGMDFVEEVAAASDVLLFGQADITATMYRPNPAYLAAARGRFCVACARAGIAPIDTNMFQEVNDMELFEEACAASRVEGFMGKAVIHPRQVSVSNRVYAVSDQELDKYRTTIHKYETADEGFALEGGNVIAPPFVAKARLMLKFYDNDNRAGRGRRTHDDT